MKAGLLFLVSACTSHALTNEITLLWDPPPLLESPGARTVYRVYSGVTSYFYNTNWDVGTNLTCQARLQGQRTHFAATALDPLGEWGESDFSDELLVRLPPSAPTRLLISCYSNVVMLDWGASPDEHGVFRVRATDGTRALEYTNAVLASHLPLTFSLLIRNCPVGRWSAVVVRDDEGEVSPESDRVTWVIGGTRAPTRLRERVP